MIAGELCAESQDVKHTSYGEEGIGLAAGRDFKVLCCCAHFMFHVLIKSLDFTIVHCLVSYSILRLIVAGPERGDGLANS